MKKFLILHFILWGIFTGYILLAINSVFGHADFFNTAAIKFILFYSQIEVLPVSVFIYLFLFWFTRTFSIKIKISRKD